MRLVVALELRRVESPLLVALAGTGVLHQALQRGPQLGRCRPGRVVAGEHVERARTRLFVLNLLVLLPEEILGDGQGGGVGQTGQGER